MMNDGFEIEDLNEMSTSEWIDKDVDHTKAIRTKRAADLKVLFDDYKPESASEDALLIWIMKRMKEAARRKFDGKADDWEDAAMGAVFAISTKLRAGSFATHLSLLKYMGTTITHFSSDAVKAQIKAEQREQPLMITKHKRKGDQNSGTFEVVNQRTPTSRLHYHSTPFTRAAQLCLSTQEQYILSTLAIMGKVDACKHLDLADNTMSQSLKRITARVAELKLVISLFQPLEELYETAAAARFLCLLLRMRMLRKTSLPQTYADALELGRHGQMDAVNTNRRFQQLAQDLGNLNDGYSATMAGYIAEDTIKARMTWNQSVRYLLKLSKIM